MTIDLLSSRAIPGLAWLGWVLLSLTARAETGETGSVAFDWFSYQGRDIVFEEPLQPGHFRNPVLAGFHPDPSIVRVGEDYYLVNSSFAWTPGLPLYHSRDLVHWKLIGHALERRSQLRFENGQGVSRGIFAPTLRHHDRLFYLITTDVDGIGNFLLTAENPAGPWSDPVTLPEIRGIDPDLFFDDDGRAWIAHNGEPEGTPLYDGHRAIWLWEFDPEKQQVVADSGRLLINGGVDLAARPIWIEGPHLYKVGGWYYLSCAEGGTAEGHSQVVFRSRNLDEPFTPWQRNPILTQRDLDPGRPHPVTSTGHADFVQTPDGDWWAVFLGVRPYDGVHHNTGRETFLLPLTWEDGWPLILAPATPLPRQAPLPQLAPAAAGVPPQTGNFLWRDEFDRPALDQEWNVVRTAPGTWYRLDPAAGVIRLQALDLPLSTMAQPAFLARRQQNLQFDAATQLEIPPNDAVSGGLAAFQNSGFHYFLGVRRRQAQVEVFLERTREGETEVIASQAQIENTGTLILGVGQTGSELDFYFAAPGGMTQWLARGVDARLLSTQVAGGFVGTMLGIHARSE